MGTPNGSGHAAPHERSGGPEGGAQPRLLRQDGLGSRRSGHGVVKAQIELAHPLEQALRSGGEVGQGDGQRLVAARTRRRD